MLAPRGVVSEEKTARVGGVGDGRDHLYGYPPDGRDDATNMVLRQMETFVDEWSPEAGR